MVIHLSRSSFDGACSALAHLYYNCGIDRDVLRKDLWVKLSIYKKGSYHKHKGAKERRVFGLSSNEGKKLLPFFRRCLRTSSRNLRPT